MNKIIEGFLKAQLPFNSPDDVHPDDKGSAEKSEIFPWEDVKKCMDDKIGAVPNHLPCPICGKPSEELDWICFSSPKWTWENLMGRMGPLSICPDCHCQVEFICMIMN